MSLNKVSLTTVIKNQFYYKLKTYIGVFTSLVILQVIAFLSSMGSTGGGFYSSFEVEINYNFYSIDNIIAFTFLWGFIHSIIMTTKTDWEKSFPFVGNRLSHDISNMIFLLIMSVIGGILTVLTDFLFKVIVYYFFTDEQVVANNFVLTGQELFSGLTTMTFHLLLFCAIGYLLGTVTRMHRMMPVLLPVIIIGGIIGLVQANSDLILRFTEFYFQEANPLTFIAKVLVSVLILFLAAVAISSRTEVRR